MTWGTLSLWLLAVGIGSAAAGDLRDPHALGLTVLLAGLVAQQLLSAIPFILEAVLVPILLPRRRSDRGLRAAGVRVRQQA